jgi:long-chain fatty acid transport protein
MKIASHPLKICCTVPRINCSKKVFSTKIGLLGVYVLALCAAFLSPFSANASSFAIRSSQSAEGLGMAYAGAASGGIGLGSIGWNPATITMFPGRNSQWNFSYVLPRASYEIDALTVANSGLVGGVAAGTGEIGGNGVFSPASYSTWQLSDRFWVGITNSAPWGLRSKAENQNYAGQIYGRSSKVTSINVTPTAGFKVNDWFSVGAGLQLQYFKADLKQALGANFGAPSSILKGDDFSWGYRVGVTFTPTPDTTIGVAYRSSIHHRLEGDFETPITLSPLVRVGKNPITANLNLPDSVVVGLSHRLSKEWQVHLGGEWTNWSRFRRIPVVLQAFEVPFSSLNFVYDDSWYFSGGVEYSPNDIWTLRAGAAYELSAVNDTVRNTRISDNDRLWLSLGASYKWSDQLTLDAGYSHLFVKNAPINIGSGHPEYNPARPVVFFGEAKPNIDVFSVALTYRWDKPAAPREPLVRKY